MKSLSVRQPWASLIASGQKTLEIRSRRTHLRGPLLICAAKGGATALPPSLPRGVALCIVDILDCRPMTPADEAAAGVAFRPGHWAWVIAHPRPVAPIPVRGNCGIFNVTLRPGESGRTDINKRTHRLAGRT